MNPYDFNDLMTFPVSSSSAQTCRHHVTVPQTTRIGTEPCVFPLQEYVLAHTEMPTTLEGAEAAIKKQEDFMTTMDANEDKINGVVEAGRRLASDGNINAERIQERVTSIDDR